MIGVGLWGCFRFTRKVIKIVDSQRPWKGQLTEGDSPVGEIDKSFLEAVPGATAGTRAIPWEAGEDHLPRLSMSLRPIVYQYREGKGEKNPGGGK